MYDVPALILAGGLGTRLRGLLPEVPKVLAPVRGRPFLCYLLDQLETAGVREVVLCTGYRAAQVRQAFGPRYHKLSLHHSCERRPLGTAGALRQALSVVKAERFLVLNGDSYIDSPLCDFYCWHRQHDSSFAGSLLLTWMENTARFGTVAVAPNGSILSFQEKCGLVLSGWINAGVYLLGLSLLESIPPDRNVSLENEVFPQWVRQGLGGYTTHAAFLDIGTPESYAQAGMVMAEAQAASGRRPRVAARLYQEASRVFYDSALGE
jgi:D-glycero-alpha-D-manno-heptose 1-phosphate guanylyltransferase